MNDKTKQLYSSLSGLGDLSIAVSGGVDSLTLALAASHAGVSFQVFHAVSPAVPPAATTRIRRFTEKYGWQLRVIDAGEFKDDNYLANPFNRCYHCKFNLYATISKQSNGQVVSGTNLDDLADFRPGLQAAAEYDVRHPFVEARMSKMEVRSLSRALGEPGLSELASSPCLSSRVETGIRIDSINLGAVDAVERQIASEYGASTVRCRVLSGGVRIELDDATLTRMSKMQLRALRAGIVKRFDVDLDAVEIAHYTMGSAFISGDDV